VNAKSFWQVFILRQRKKIRVHLKNILIVELNNANINNNMKLKTCGKNKTVTSIIRLPIDQQNFVSDNQRFIKALSFSAAASEVF